jgi:hypothetical protein
MPFHFAEMPAAISPFSLSPDGRLRHAAIFLRFHFLQLSPRFIQPLFSFFFALSLAVAPRHFQLMAITLPG